MKFKNKVKIVRLEGNRLPQPCPLDQQKKMISTITNRDIIPKSLDLRHLAVNNSIYGNNLYSGFVLPL